jgi:CheY-like chemotaxis protein
MLFHPFTQADSTSSRKYGGTGLGLSITRRLVDALGGSISLESERNKGSLFRVILPVGVGSNVADGSLRAWDRVRRDDKPLRDRHILVVDDRDEICKLVSKYIEDAGGRAEGRNDGASAVDAIAKASAPFDAMILDIHMPVMDGYEVARTLRAKGNPIPIIALTASAMVGDREKCLEAGCDEYLTKPIDRDQLVQALAHQTQRKTAVAVKKDNLKILLVDDSEAACKLMTTILVKRGHEVRSALDGHSAIDMALTFHPDVLFLDMRLPDMTGNELLHRLKTLGVIPHAKFIGLSGYRASDIPGATDFDHFLEKPLDAACLDTVLNSL